MPCLLVLMNRSHTEYSSALAHSRNAYSVVAEVCIVHGRGQKRWLPKDVINQQNRIFINQINGHTMPRHISLFRKVPKIYLHRIDDNRKSKHTAYTYENHQDVMKVMVVVKQMKNIILVVLRKYAFDIHTHSLLIHSFIPSCRSFIRLLFYIKYLPINSLFETQYARLSVRYTLYFIFFSSFAHCSIFGMFSHKRPHLLDFGRVIFFRQHNSISHQQIFGQENYSVGMP